MVSSLTPPPASHQQSKDESQPSLPLNVPPPLNMQHATPPPALVHGGWRQRSGLCGQISGWNLSPSPVEVELALLAGFALLR